MGTTQEILEQTLPPEEKAPNTAADLSSEIAETVSRQVGDLVRCRRVSKTMYRCNWLARDLSEAAGGSRFIQAYRIRDSKFLRVVRVDGKLVIEDLTGEDARKN
jgi:hypothetical protein